MVVQKLQRAQQSLKMSPAQAACNRARQELSFPRLEPHQGTLPHRDLVNLTVSHWYEAASIMTGFKLGLRQSNSHTETERAPFSTRTHTHTV